MRITWAGKDAQGMVIAASTMEFEVAGFSNFDFGNTERNSQGPPSSSVFSNNVSRAAVHDIDRTNLDVDAI